MDVLTVPLESPLLISREDNVVVLTLNRPRQFNALSLATLHALHAALDTIRDDTATRVVVIAANGNAFCAGHDLKEMRAANDQALVTNLFRLCSDMMLKIAKLPVPVIAEVNGMATAAGCQLVAQCDLAVAVDQARFAVSGVNLGLFCSTPAVPLSRTIARKRAAEMLMTGEFIDAATALEWGLVNRVVAPTALRAETLRLAASLKTKPRATLAAGKALLYRQMEVGIEAAYADATDAIACNFMLPEAQEGIAAFLEKRKPVWE